MKALVTVIGTFTIVLLSACQPDSLVRTAISEAQGNASEIQRVLDNYKDERADVAGYMVAAMVGQYAMHGAGTDSVEALYRRLRGYLSHFPSCGIENENSGYRLKISTLSDKTV